jgi:hypothetical protein
MAIAEARTMRAVFQEAADDADFTRICSDRPGTPGRRQQMPRTTQVDASPRPALARYSASIDLLGSTREFIFSPDAGRLAFLARSAISRFDQASSRVGRRW